MTLQEIRDKLVTLREEANAITAKADAESRQLTNEEITQANEKVQAFDQLKAELETRQSLTVADDWLSKSQGRRADPVQPVVNDNVAAATSEDRSGVPHVTGGTFRNDDKAQWGWRSIGEFAKAVHDYCQPGGERCMDKRLETRASLSTFGQEAVGPDGGFGVAPGFSSEIMVKVLGEESLLSRTAQGVSGTNNMTFPVDEDTPWSTSGGIQAFWEGEADAFAQSKPNLKQQTLRLNKVTCLVPITDELLEDAPALGSYLNRKAPEKIDFKVNLAIIQGTGAGQPLGILGSDALVSVAKVGSQVADTLVGQNIIDMWSRMYAPSRAKSVWLINQDVEPQLDTLMIQGKLNTGAVDTGWGGILYMPANGLAGGGFATLKGRPVIPTQACETLGDKGDIILADLSQYMTLMKSQGLRTDTSIHLWFDQATTAFRFILRLAGQPALSAPISPRVGSTTLSPFVTLDARA